MSEKINEPNVERVNSIDRAKNVVEVKEVKGAEAYNEALLKEPLSWHHSRQLALFGCLIVGFFCQTMNGFDGSLFGGLTANKVFLKHFNGENKGIWAGIITSMFQIGGVSALPFVGPAIDTYGRRVGMCIGSLLIVIGTVIMALTSVNASEGQFMGGRFLVGFGVTIAAAAGPIWIVETAHPRFRGIVTGLCNCCWLVGSILASGSIRGALNLDGNKSWLLPIWLQLFFPGLIIIFCFLVPESPRWLYANGKTETAIATLAKWHGNGNRESAWVRLQLSEYESSIELNGSDKRFWDYRGLFNKRSNTYRVMVACWFSAMTQWCGNGPLSYFMPAVLTTAGINDSISQTNVNLGYNCLQLSAAIVGAFFVEKIGRRKLMMTGFFGTSLVWVCMTAAAGTLSKSWVSGSVAASDAVYSNHSAANAVLAFIFIFGVVYSFNLTPLQSLYPVECISYEIRAKGMALQAVFVNVAGLVNTYAWSVAIKEISWKTYIIFIIETSLFGVISFFVFPETRKRTLEELNDIFEAKNPVKFSTATHTIALNEDKTVIAIDEDARQLHR